MIYPKGSTSLGGILCIRIKTLKDDLVTALSKTIELFGLSTLESRFFYYMYLVDGPKTLDEMSEALGKSKTAMSTSIRSLAEFNLVSQVSAERNPERFICCELAII